MDNLNLPSGVIAGICREYQVSSLAIFGSAVSGHMRPDSDVDFLVAFNPGSRVSLFEMAGLAGRLGELVGRKVDLVEKEAIRNPFRKRRIMDTMKVLYAA